MVLQIVDIAKINLHIKASTPKKVRSPGFYVLEIVDSAKINLHIKALILHPKKLEVRVFMY